MAAKRAAKRLTKDHEEWVKYKRRPVGMSAKPRETEDGIDYFIWDCVIPGPDKTAWEGARFDVELRFPETYPLDHPTALFKYDKFPHPNVSHMNGNVCMPLFSDNGWIPAMTVTQVLLRLGRFLEPEGINIEDPYGHEYTYMYRDNQEAFWQVVKEFAAKHQYDPFADDG